MRDTEFFEKKEMILDLIRAVYLHERIRAAHGPGMGALMDQDYTTAHSVMSKLSRELGPMLNREDLQAMAEKYKDLPEHIGISPQITMSC